MVNALEQLVESVNHFTTPQAYPTNVSNFVEEKMVAMKTQIMQDNGVKMKEGNKEVKDT
jgi:hypothetical protein